MTSEENMKWRSRRLSVKKKKRFVNLSSIHVTVYCQSRHGGSRGITSSLNIHKVSSHLQMDKILVDMERKYEKELAECREESKQNLMRMKEEHATQVYTRN